MAREVATFVRAVRDCGNRLLATPYRPKPDSRVRLEVGCSLALVESTKAKASTNSAGYVEHWAGGQREKCCECEKEQLPPFVVKQGFAKLCRSLESIQPMRSPVRFRHLSPYPHKSAVMAKVFGSVTSWRTEGQDQMLLLLGDTLIHGFRATCNCLATKQQVSRQRTERLSVPRGGVNRAPAMRRSLMSRRRLTRYDLWSAKQV